VGLCRVIAVEGTVRKEGEEIERLR
jgi:hypothetical protein